MMLSTAPPLNIKNQFQKHHLKFITKDDKITFFYLVMADFFIQTDKEFYFAG